MPQPLVLVVDDDPDLAELVQTVLVLEGYRVVAAGNGQEAIEVVARELPELVLLDMRMPVMDGWGFAKAARPRWPAMKICVMTAAVDARAWAQEVQANAYLDKPFELNELIAVVERLCPIERIPAA